jgi:plasmid stabilization system protein ParE
MNVHYSREAMLDLVRLRKFITDHNPIAAKRIASELLTAIEKLKVFPRMGVCVGRSPDPEAVRDLFIDQYTVRYLLTTSDIFILRVWHDKEEDRNS